MTESTTSMIALLREARGWNQTKLAEESKLSQAIISRLESGTLEPGAERVASLAIALDCPPSILTSDPTVPALQISCLHHRRRSSTMTVGTMRRIEAITHLTRLSVEGLLDGVEPQPQLPLERIQITDHQGPVDIARRIRREWGIPSGPIVDLTRIVEAAGIMILVRDLATAGQDAVSTWPDARERPPMMIVNSGLPGDRLRFTIAHELAHLTMHDLPGDGQEDEANLFAGEFLAPADEISNDLAGLRTGDFRRLMALKTKWGISMAALIRRAHDLHQITDRQYREFHVRLGQLGWRKSEPGALPVESARTVGQIINLHRQTHHYDISTIAALAGMNEPAFRRHYLHEEAPAAARTPLRLGVEDE